MDLIKKFGGYENAKDGLHRLKLEKKDLLTCGDLVVVKSEIDAALLEYRREHNIFEVGDKVVKTNSKIKHAHIRVVISTSPSGGAVLDYHGFPYKHPCIRHATDEEIAAGHRL